MPNCSWTWRARKSSVIGLTMALKASVSRNCPEASCTQARKGVVRRRLAWSAVHISSQQGWLCSSTSHTSQHYWAAGRNMLKILP